VLLEPSFGIMTKDHMYGTCPLFTPGDPTILDRGGANPVVLMPLLMLLLLLLLLPLPTLPPL
jgi:hypothetical protein